MSRYLSTGGSRRAIPLAAFLVIVFLGAGSPLRGDQPKSLDCLQVFVVGSDSVMSRSNPPIRVRVLHLVLKNICSVDITAFSLEADMKSPVAQKHKQGVDMVYQLHTASPAYEKIPLAGRDFPYDFGFRDDPAGELPFEGTVKVKGIAFRDVTAVGDADWVKRMNEDRQLDLKNFTDERELLVKVAHLDDAKALLKGDPDDSLNNQVKAFWREIQQNVGNDPVKWGAYVNRRVNEVQIFISLLKEQSELRREGN
jgi:hypothetical protein